MKASKRTLQTSLRALRSNLIVYLITLSLVLCITPLTQAADYTFTKIDPPGSAWSKAYGINDAGQIVGYYLGDDRREYGFLRNSGGGYITIDPTIDPPGSVKRSKAIGINDSGQIVGEYLGDDQRLHSFLRNSGGGYVMIDPPGHIHSSAIGINDSGQIVGAYWVGNGVYHGYLRNWDGGYVTINPPGSTGVSAAMGINDSGQIVGYAYWGDDGRLHGFLRNSGGGYVMIDPPGSTWSEARGINDSGQIVGRYRDSRMHGFLRNPDGGYITIDPPGSVDSSASGINDSGQIVGWYNDGTRLHGFLAIPGQSNEICDNGMDDDGDGKVDCEDPECPECPKLFVTIPGINDHGAMMLEGAKKIVRYDDECKVFIMEKLRPSITAVQKAVADASKKAKEKGKDVVVLIDMDLENYTFEFPLPPALNRWKRSVVWAGKMANIVSEAFSKEAPGGKRIIYAHSAGGDATYQTVLQTPRKKGKRQRMYDDINIFNGRTSAINLKNVLKSGGYGWRQVKVFTNDGDCPANPFWALANYDVVKRYAGASWVHLHCCDIITCTDPLSFCGCHSALRDSIPDGSIGTFEVNLSPKTGTPDCTEVATVKDLMTRDWR